MEFIALLLIIYFLIGACVCLLICVNPNDQGVLSRLNRFAFRKVPQVFSNAVRRFFGQGVLNCLGGVKHYIMETNHPLVQIFYLLISPVGFALYQYYGIFKHMPNNKIPGIHVAIANFLALICFWVYYKACATSPGEITKQNVQSYIQKYKEYYDQQIYKTNNKCKTCTFNKPARSKHCSICKMCVGKHDHHCIWIRQCVGEKNYKYFISFLFLHSVWCLYLSVIGAISLIEYLNRINFFSMRFNIDGRAVPADGLLAVQYLFMSETIFFFLIVMCAIMGFTLLLFVLYHLYLVSKGQTTNERVKKNDDIDYYQKELIASKKMMSRFTEGVQQIDFKGEKVTKQDLQSYQSLCRKKIAILTKVYCKKGFWGKLQDVFNL